MRLNGNVIADRIRAELSARSRPDGILAIVQVGSDPVSEVYISKKLEFASALGIKCQIFHTDGNDIYNLINKLNGQENIRAIIVQLPLPENINRDDLLKKIDIAKDVDGFHYILDTAGAKIIPPTVLAIRELLNFYKISLANGVLIVGGGFLVGRPLEKFLRSTGVRCEILLKDDPDYQKKLQNADVSVIATGGGKKFSLRDFQEGATVIDASTLVESRQIRGDVEPIQESKINLAPVPGGIGPITVAMLFRNFYDL